MKKLFLLVLLPLFAGCVKFTPVAYELSMQPMSKFVGEKFYTYVDGDLTFAWSWGILDSHPIGYAPVLTIQNDGSSTIKLIWSESVMVDQDGQNHPVFDFSKVSAAAADGVLRDAIILPNSTFISFIAKTDNIYHSRKFSEARPTLYGTAPGNKAVGEKFAFYMMLDIDGKKKGYTFVFTVENILLPQ